MLGGIVGKILRVDLSDKSITAQGYDEDLFKKYIGGDGVAARLLYDELPLGIHPLEPENILVISAGPLVGTNLQASCNTSVVAKSPITGFTLYNSHVNGSFAQQLKFAGYDALIIRGKATNPVYLWLHDGNAEIKDASSIWGKDTYDTVDLIQAELRQPKLSCMCIGPAGENEVLISCIVVDKTHVAARGGLGAVMGSKNLKAVAAYGTGNVLVADAARFRTVSREFRTTIMGNFNVKRMADFGSAGALPGNYKCGDLPIRNWSQGVLEGWENISGEYLVRKWFKRHVTCPSCTEAHNKLLEINDGEFKGEYNLPEYEICAAVGSNIGVTDPAAVVKGADLLNRYGLDGLGASNVIGLVMECIEKGLVTKNDIGGLDLAFGNYRTAWEMMAMITKRSGFGNIMADGPVRTAEYIGKGAEKFVVHVKGMPMVMHDHRAFWGYALTYAIGSAGPAHEGGPLYAERYGDIPRFSTEGKAQAVKQGQAHRCILNSLGICSFGAVGGTLGQLAEALSACSGIEFTANELRTIGMRQINLRRGFNIRNGLVPADDTLPYRYTDVAHTDGGAEGKVVPIKPMVREYYNLMGWDLKTGKPYRRTLANLGLEDVSEDLWG